MKPYLLMFRYLYPHGMAFPDKTEKMYVLVYAETSDAAIAKFRGSFTGDQNYLQVVSATMI